jgi:anaerobic selenocysteine-containing dehydrogenase
VDIGSNMAENHPVGFQWVMEARLRGAKVIHVDPRYTRTSAVSHLHVPIRAGTDIAFLGGIVNYILENERYFEEYVKTYTNAATIINEDFQDTEDLDGVFSGWDPDSRSYDASTWRYAGTSVSGTAGRREQGGITGEQAHGARRELPFVFAASSTASAGAAAAILTPIEEAGPARRLAVGGAIPELVLTEVMKRRLGRLLAEPYDKEEARRYEKIAKVLTGVGAAVMELAGRKRRLAAVAGGELVLAGAATERWAVFKAGFQSARDPKYTVLPQRDRLESSDGSRVR